MVYLTAFYMLICIYWVHNINNMEPLLIDDVLNARLQAESSRQSCPQVPSGKLCRWKTSAKTNGRWEACYGELPPTGAGGLPARRWFRLEGSCKIFGVPFPVPWQFVYRN